jgi:hypothetical protein
MPNSPSAGGGSAPVALFSATLACRVGHFEQLGTKVGFDNARELADAAAE